MSSVYAPAIASAQALRPHRHGNAPTCDTCGAVIVAKRGSRRQRFCSPKCRDTARRERNFHKIGRARYPRSGVPRSVKNSINNSEICMTGLHPPRHSRSAAPARRNRSDCAARVEARDEHRWRLQLGRLSAAVTAGAECAMNNTATAKFVSTTNGPPAPSAGIKEGV